MKKAGNTVPEASGWKPCAAWKPGKGKPRCAAIEHIKALLHSRNVPGFPAVLDEIPELRDIHEEIANIRRNMEAFIKWDLTEESGARGIIPGYLKSLKSNLRRIVWRVRKVERGDMSPQEYTMGEFSAAFNSMVKQLDKTLQDMRAKEESLEEMASSLRTEVKERDSEVEALHESESRFRYLASHDPLTGALNRSSFMERAARELKAAVLRHIPCSLAMMDIDLFKRFNDTRGHLAGDEALRHAVNVVSSGLRKDDFMGRYGGEEFVFFFSGTKLETGNAICERLRKNLASAPLNLDTGPAFITASFGVAEMRLEDFSVPPESIDFSADKNGAVRQLVDKADRALYQAKNSGRNQVASFSEHFPERLPVQDGPDHFLE